MIIRAQESFNFINFDNVKTIGIETRYKKFQIIAKTTKNDESIGITLAEYSNIDYAKKELKRFYQAYQAGEKTFMFRGEETINFCYGNGDTEDALLKFFTKIVLDPERLSELVLKLAKKETETEKNGSGKEI